MLPRNPNPTMAETPAGTAAPEETAKLRVMLVDDHVVIRSGLRVLIEQSGRYDICAEAGDAPHALALMRRHRPKLAVVDVSLNSTNGIELTKGLLAEQPDLKVLVLSSYPEEIYAERALRAGARGYLMKDAAVENILVALDQIHRGAIFLSPTLKRRVLERFITEGPDRPASPGEVLTDREIEILELIGEGFSLSDIAARLHLSTKTVSSYRDNLRSKLGLGSGPELLRHAIAWVRKRTSG